MRTIQAPKAASQASASPLRLGPDPLEALAGVVEAGFLVAASDGLVDEAELDLIAAVLAGALGREVTHDQLMDLLEACANTLENDGWEERVDVVASLLATDESRALALTVMAAVLAADEDTPEPSEDEVFTQLYDALGFTADDAARAVDRARALRA